MFSSIEELKELIKKGTSEEEAKSLLFILFIRIKMLEEKEYPEEKFIKGCKDIYLDFLRYKSTQLKDENKKDFNKVHIVFGDSPAGSLKMALREMDLAEKEQIIRLSDLFSVGSIYQLHKKSGMIEKGEWMEEHLNYEEEIDIYNSYYKRTIRKIKDIPSDRPIVIWTADNSHEQTALRFILYLLKDIRNNIYIINTTSSFQKHIPLSAGTECMIRHTGEISPDQLKVIYTKNKKELPITLEERKKLVQEWELLSQSKEVLRIWDNGQIRSVPEDYYDSYILCTVKKLHKKKGNRGFIKAARVIGEVIGYLDQYIGDQYIEYRLRQLIINGDLMIQGVPRAMRYYSVKLS
ncbi:MAG: DUF1835 domain-containing protein [Bacillus sp. (in: firmicutes)]